MLVLPQHVFDEIRDVAYEKEGFETGVSLFGVRVQPHECPAGALPPLVPRTCNHVVLAIAGPGPRAVHLPARYSSDADFSTAVYWALQSALPRIRWLGELHVHPRGMPSLSGRDLANAREILLGTDETLHPEEFIAGVIQQWKDRLDIYPFHFTRQVLEGVRMGVERVSSDAKIVHDARTIACGGNNDRPSVRTEPEGSGAPLGEAPRRHWTWKFWRRDHRDGGESRRGHVYTR